MLRVQVLDSRDELTHVTLFDWLLDKHQDHRFCKVSPGINPCCRVVVGRVGNAQHSTCFGFDTYLSVSVSVSICACGCFICHCAVPVQLTSPFLESWLERVERKYSSDAKATREILALKFDYFREKRNQARLAQTALQLARLR